MVLGLSRSSVLALTTPMACGVSDSHDCAREPETTTVSMA